MNRKTHNIILVKRGSIEGFVLSSQEQPKILERFSLNWTSKNIDDVLSQCITRFATKKLLILLGEELVYELELVVPKAKKKRFEKSVVLAQLQETVPEDIDDSDWSYTVLSSNATQSTIVAYVPVQLVFQDIARAVAQNACEVVSVIPEQFAHRIQTDAAIGAATLIQSKDKRVETVSLPLPSSMDMSQQKNSPAAQSLTSVPWLKPVYGLAVAAGILVGLAMILVLFFTVFRSQSAIINTSSLPSPLPTPAPSLSTLEKNLDFSEFSVQILNGSGVPREADSLAELFRKGGFEEISIGNADVKANSLTLVQVKEGTRSAQLLDTVVNVLSQYTTTIGAPLSQTEKFDIKIQIGDKNE